MAIREEQEDPALLCPFGFKPWERTGWGKQCQKKSAEDWTLVRKAAAWCCGDSCMLYREGTVNPWSPGLWCYFLLCCLFVIIPFPAHSDHWAPTLECALFGFWLCSNHRHVFPKPNQNKKVKHLCHHLHRFSSPPKHVQEVQRPDLDISSLFSPFMLCFVHFPSVHISLGNLWAFPFSFCLTHGTI